MTKNQAIDLHNRITKLHLITNSATDGRSTVKWEELMGAAIEILIICKDHISELKAPIAHKEPPKSEPKLSKP